MSVFRVGYVQSKPYQFKSDDGVLQGVVVNATKILAGDLLKVDLEWVESSWDTMIAGLQADKYDIIMHGAPAGARGSGLVHEAVDHRRQRTGTLAKFRFGLVGLGIIRRRRST